MLRKSLILGAFGVLAILQCIVAVEAAEKNPVRWHNDVNEAWKSSQAQGRPLLVFVTRADCLPCAKMKIGTYSDRAVANAINEHYVAVAIDGAKPSVFLKELAVNSYPATFVISPEAVILHRIDGYVTADQMKAQLAAIALKETPRLPVRPVVTSRAF